MRLPVLAVPFLLIAALGGCRKPASADATLTAWAYPHNTQEPNLQTPPGTYALPGSRVTLTGAQLSDDQTAADWFPERHPTPPTVVLTARPPRGRADGPTPCGACHLVEGQGFLGAPNLAGLPAAYIEQQVREFREGRRRSSAAGFTSTGEMITVAKKVRDDELGAAARYFASLRMTPRYRVVESDTAPAVTPDKYGWLDVAAGKPREPLDGRVVEVAEDFRRMLLNDPNYVVTDYVPKGAVAKGAALVKSGGAAGQPCAGCHGADLKGMGEAPPLAGRSAPYLARQLWDIRSGARGGPAVAAMQPVAAKLGAEDVTNIVAYLTSLTP